MKQFSRSERKLIYMVLLALVVYAGDRAWSAYQMHKEEMQVQIDSFQTSNGALLQRLQSESAADYRERTESLTKELENVRDRILKVRQLNDASLRIRSDLSKMSEHAGLTMSYVRDGGTSPINEETGLIEVQTKIASNTSLEELLVFMDSWKEMPYYLAIDRLTINARNTRRQRRITRRSRRQVREIEPLSVTAQIATAYLPTSEDLTPPTQFNPVPRLKHEDEAGLDEGGDEGLIEEGEDPDRPFDVAEDDIDPEELKGDPGDDPGLVPAGPAQTVDSEDVPDLKQGPLGLKLPKQKPPTDKEKQKANPWFGDDKNGAATGQKPNPSQKPEAKPADKPNNLSHGAKPSKKNQPN